MGTRPWLDYQAKAMVKKFKKKLLSSAGLYGVGSSWVGLGQTVASWLELELVQSKKLELGWLGSVTKSNSEMGISRLSTARKKS